MFGEQRQGGLGWYIFQNRNELYTDKVFAGLAVVVLIGLLVENLVFGSIERLTVKRWGVQRQGGGRVECYGNFLGNCCAGAAAKRSNVLPAPTSKDGTNVALRGSAAGVLPVRLRHLRHARSEQHHVAGLGVNFGFVRSIPHILGISCGFFIMVMAVGFGLGTVFEAYPVLYTILRMSARPTCCTWPGRSPPPARPATTRRDVASR